MKKIRMKKITTLFMAIVMIATMFAGCGKESSTSNDVTPRNNFVQHTLYEVIRAGNLTGEPRRYALEPGIPGFIKFFDPYIYREAITFASEEEATKYYLAKLREQIIYEGRESVAAIVIETITGSYNFV